MKKIFITVGLVFSIFLSMNCLAEKLIDHYLIQFAGEIGFLSTGIGRSFSNYEIAGMYGLVPSAISKVDAIQTIALRQTYIFYEKSKLRLFVGLNVFHILGRKNQSYKFSRAPANYYAQSSTRALGNLGLLIHTSKKEGLYFEAGMTDMWVENYVNNSRILKANDYLSLTLGFKKEF